MILYQTTFIVIGVLVMQSMLQSFRVRFDMILNPNHASFNPLPAASCLLDSTVGAVLLQEESADLLRAAKTYITHQSSASAIATTTPTNRDPEAPAALKKFKFLANKMKAAEPVYLTDNT